MNPLKDIYEQCTIDPEEGVIHLPRIQLDRKTYTEVKKQMDVIGGKWNRFKDGFVFGSDPTALFEMQKLDSGEFAESGTNVAAVIMRICK